MRVALVALFWPGLALAEVPLAEVPLSGEEFAARVEGRVLAFSMDGTVWGHERYFPGARVIWEGLDGQCLEGVWRETVEGFICFSYQVAPMDLHCARFFDAGQGLRLERRGVAAGDEVARAEVTGRPLHCKGPEVGA